ncbi:hypothetical protein WJX81_001425 [Elliptochloris bilobata]|uniref:RRM domain-containing protein n=1 Tax=Elliptochloris bilobata TaxID=381761 RepID=A0AAW1RUD0_9CHLO
MGSDAVELVLQADGDAAVTISAPEPAAPYKVTEDVNGGAEGSAESPPPLPPVREHNLYVKHFEPSLDSAGLQSLFEDMGEVVSGAVLYDHLGVSKQVGFVQMRTAGEAQRCVDELHGKLVGGPKPLHVALALPKLERQASARKAAGARGGAGPHWSPHAMALQHAGAAIQAGALMHTGPAVHGVVAPGGYPHGAAPLYFPGAFAPDNGAYPAPYPAPCYAGHTLVGYAWCGGAPPYYAGAPYGGGVHMGGPHMMGPMAPPFAGGPGAWVISAAPRWEPYWGAQGYALGTLATAGKHAAALNACAAAFEPNAAG